jgi:hypothetical protein
MSDIITGGNLIAAITGGVFFTQPLAHTVEGTDLLVVSPASIVADYIVDTLAKMTWPRDKGNWPLYVSHLPDGKNVKTNCGCVYDTTGLLDTRQMNGRWPLHPGIQIRIRARGYEVGFGKIEDIASALDELVNESVTTSSGVYEIQNLSRSTPVVPLGPEVGTTRRRFLFTVNYLATIKKLS